MTVIVVEDEPLTRMDMLALLKQEGIEVVGEGGDGIDAINLCKKHRPDVAILDINLPIIDGISAAKIIKRDQLCRAVLLVTAYTEEIILERASKAGVDGYMIKPIDARMLIPAIKIALAKAEEREYIEKQLQQTTKKLESRKVVERAKGAIMHREQLSEKEAYEKLRSISMQKNCTMEELSTIILAAIEDVS